MKDYGHLVGTAEAVAFAARVRDVHEWLAAHVDALPPPRRAARPGDRAGSRATCATCSGRTCPCARCSPATPTSSSSTTTACAAGRAAPTRRCSRSSRPRSASASWRRSSAPARRVGATVVASANPGCAMHLAAAGVTVRHPVDLVAEAAGLASATSERARRATRRSRRCTAPLGRSRDDGAPWGARLPADWSRSPPSSTTCRSTCSTRRSPSGATERPDADRTLTQARRAVEKAAHAARLAGVNELTSIDHGPQVAVAVPGELEADAREVDVVVLADLDRQRRRCARSCPDATRCGEALVELGQLLVGRGVAQADHGLVADVADRVVVGVEALDLARTPRRSSR